MSAAGTAAAERFIHRGGVGRKPTVDDVSSALRALGFQKAHDNVIRYGVVDCTAAIAYVAAQRGRYAARNPGGLVRWILAHRESLGGWQASRLRGFLVRFRQVPEWIRDRIAKWLGLLVPPEPSKRRPTPRRELTATSAYRTLEEVEADKARDERRFAEYMKRTGQW